MPKHVNMVLPASRVQVDQQSMLLLLARKPSWHSLSGTLPLSGPPLRYLLPWARTGCPVRQGSSLVRVEGKQMGWRQNTHSAPSREHDECL